MSIVDYIEKPVYTFKVSMGIYVFEGEVLRYIQPNKYLDFPDLVRWLLADGRTVTIRRCTSSLIMPFAVSTAMFPLQDIGAREVTLPPYAGMSRRQLEYVITSIQEWAVSVK